MSNEQKKYYSSVDIINELATKLQTTKKDGKLIIAAVRDVISDMLADRGEVRVDGFGTFRASKRAARKGQNPRTGEAVDIPESVVACFRAGKALRTKIAPKAAK